MTINGYFRPTRGPSGENLGKSNKSAPVVLEALHTFLINNLLIFKNFSVIMNIQTRVKPLPHLTSTSLSFSYLSFLFGRSPELTGHQHRASFDSFLHKDGRPERRGRRSLRSEFHTQSGYQRPVGKFYSPYGSHDPPVPHLPRAKPGTPSVSQRPVGRFLLALRLARPISHELGTTPCVGFTKNLVYFLCKV